MTVRVLKCHFEHHLYGWESFYVGIRFPLWPIHSLDIISCAKCDFDTWTTWKSTVSCSTWGNSVILRLVVKHMLEDLQCSCKLDWRRRCRTRTGACCWDAAESWCNWSNRSCWERVGGKKKHEWCFSNLTALLHIHTKKIWNDALTLTIKCTGDKKK